MNADRMTAARIATYSALILFFELALIRYTAGYVRLFGFYVNFVLIATFLGMGVGLLRSDAVAKLQWTAIPATLMLFYTVLLFSHASIVVPTDQHEYIWAVFQDEAGERVSLSVVAATLFALIAFFFIPLGSLLGDQFRKLPALQAYTADLAGSLAGIAAFAAFSALRQPPVVWFSVGFAAWALVSLDRRRFAGAVLAVGVIAAVFALRQRERFEYWSPYYRINLVPGTPGVRVLVNGSLHQIVLDLDSVGVSRDRFNSVVRAAYTRPYRWAGRIDTVLVVGAGTGNDLAVLLQQGAKYVDAVEIDPVIADLGRVLHPQKPYDDPRIHVHIDDARAFLRRTTQKYDLIIFGTLDSQTLLSGMSSVRLDNYVYTVESFQSARRALKEHGSVALYHMSPYPYIAAKIYQMVGTAMERPPGVVKDYMLLFNMIVVAGDAAPRVPAAPAALIDTLSVPYAAATDNWPYLYLSQRTLPGHYRAALLSVLILTVLFVGMGARGVVRRGFDAPMFFMGAGFLLVETKSVTEMSLLFGSTWRVNLLVFASILVMVLLANLVVLRRPLPPVPKLFAGLFVALGIAFLLPASQLLWLGTLGQWIVGGLMVALPVFFAALIFSSLFKTRTDAPRALAWNLLGAIVGGVLEYSSMAFGIKALYVIAAALYLAAMLWNARGQHPAPAPGTLS